MSDYFKVVGPAMLALIVAFGGGNALAAGDAAKGEKAFKRCSACHALEEGKNKVGPSLYNIVGRTAGSVDGYKYSPVFAEAAEKGLVWEPEQLVAYLEDPRKYLAEFVGKDKIKTKMANKFKKLELRQDIVAYLQSLQ